MQFRFFRLAFAAFVSTNAATVVQPSAAEAARLDPPSASESAQPAPGNAAVRLFQAWLHEAQTADDAAYVQFMREHVPGSPGGPDEWLQFRHLVRGERLYSVRSTTADGAE